MCFSRSRRRLTSAPYLPTVPSSTRRKWECRLLRTFSLLRGFNSVWYGATICGLKIRQKFLKLNEVQLLLKWDMPKTSTYISANQIIPILNDSPWRNPNSANFLWRSGTVFLESVTYVLCHTFKMETKNIVCNILNHVSEVRGPDLRVCPVRPNVKQMQQTRTQTTGLTNTTWNPWGKRKKKCIKRAVLLCGLVLVLARLQ